MLSMLVYGSNLGALAAQPIFPTPHKHCLSDKPALLSTAPFVPKPKFKPSSPLSLSVPFVYKQPTRLRLSSAAAEEALQTPDANEAKEEEKTEGEAQDKKQRLGMVVKAMEKPRVVLKFIWMEKNIGLALDQAIAGHGTIPLSPYYFWPRKDAWEELKSLLENKPWISQKRMIILLNQATDIINLWQQSGGNL